MVGPHEISFLYPPLITPHVFECTSVHFNSEVRVKCSGVVIGYITCSIHPCKVECYWSLKLALEKMPRTLYLNIRFMLVNCGENQTEYHSDSNTNKTTDYFSQRRNPWEATCARWHHQQHHKHANHEGFYHPTELLSSSETTRQRTSPPLRPSVRHSTFPLKIRFTFW